jgi:hypothetical protein
VSPGVLNVVVGLAYLPLSLTLTALRFVDVMHHISDSVVQFVQHVRGIFRKGNSLPSLQWRLAVSRSRVVGSVLVWPMFLRAVFFRVVFVSPMRVRAMFFRAPVPARLRKLLYISDPGLTSRVALVDAGGIRRVLVRHHENT